MKVALLLNGFIRDTNNLNVVKKFLELNKDYNIDLYTSTYNVIGLKYKMTSGSRQAYETTKVVTEEFLKSKLPFKKILIEDINEVKKECDQFSSDHKSFHSSHSPDSESILSNIFSQWRNLYKTYSLIEDLSEYNWVIRYRFDLNGKNLKLSEYTNTESDKVYMKCVKHFKGLYKNGLVGPICRDGCVIGATEAMKKVCSIGKYENYSQLIRDPNNYLIAKDGYWGGNLKKPCYYSNESNLTYWCIKNNLKILPINEHHLPGSTLTRLGNEKQYKR